MCVRLTVVKVGSPGADRRAPSSTPTEFAMTHGQLFGDVIQCRGRFVRMRFAAVDMLVAQCTKASAWRGGENFKP